MGECAAKQPGSYFWGPSGMLRGINLSGREGKSWEIHACICICVSAYAYKNMYTHTQRKQNNTEKFIAHGCPTGRRQENKQAADVNHATMPTTGGRSDPAVMRWCEKPTRTGGNRRPPRQKKTTEAERSPRCRHTGHSAPLVSPQVEEVPVDILVPRCTLRDGHELLHGRRDGPGGGLQGGFFTESCSNAQSQPTVMQTLSTTPIPVPGGVSSCTACKEQK